MNPWSAPLIALTAEEIVILATLIMEKEPYSVFLLSLKTPSLIFSPVND